MIPDHSCISHPELFCSACMLNSNPTRATFDRQYISSIASEITRHGGKESQPYFAKRIAEAGRSVIGSLADGAEPDDELRAWLKVITAAMSLS